MGWIIRAGELRSTSFELSRNAGVTTFGLHVTSTPCPGGAQWRFNPECRQDYIPNHDGDKPVFQVQVWKSILPLLVGT